MYYQPSKEDDFESQQDREKEQKMNEQLRKLRSLPSHHFTVDQIITLSQNPYKDITGLAFSEIDKIYNSMGIFFLCENMK